VSLREGVCHIVKTAVAYAVMSKENQNVQVFQIGMSAASWDGRVGVRTPAVPAKPSSWAAERKGDRVGQAPIATHATTVSARLAA
jgi:hypothetical protein